MPVPGNLGAVNHVMFAALRSRGPKQPTLCRVPIGMRHVS